LWSIECNDNDKDDITNSNDMTVTGYTNVTDYDTYCEFRAVKLNTFTRIVRDDKGVAYKLCDSWPHLTMCNHHEHERVKQFGKSYRIFENTQQKQNPQFHDFMQNEFNELRDVYGFLKL
jgi:hypothetical protein